MRRRERRFLRTRVLLVPVLVLVGLRVALPYALLDYANRTLDRIPSYDGQIGGVDVHLWRGAYQLKDVDIVKTDGKVPVPFFSSPEVDFSVDWRALLDGAWVGEVVVLQPKVNFVQGPSDDQKQTGMGNQWATKVQELFPLRIDRLEVKDGQVHFLNFHKDPQIDIYVDNIHITGLNLTNSRNLGDSMVATVVGQGKTLGRGEVTGVLKVDPLAKLPTFDLDLQLTNVELHKLNDFWKAYGNFDVDNGKMDLFVEAAAKDGKFNGYVKPLFDDLQIFSLDEKHESLTNAFWEAVVGGTAEVLKNQRAERLGARIPVKGNVEGPDADVWSTVGSILHNAFIKVLLPKLDGTVNIKEVKG